MVKKQHSLWNPYDDSEKFKRKVFGDGFSEELKRMQMHANKKL